MKSQDLIVSGKLFKVFPQNSPTNFAWRQSWTKWKSQGSQVDLLDHLRSSKKTFLVSQAYVMQIRSSFYHRLRSSVWSSRPIVPSHTPPQQDILKLARTQWQPSPSTHNPNVEVTSPSKNGIVFSRFSPFSLGNQAPVRLANQFCL